MNPGDFVLPLLNTKNLIPAVYNPDGELIGYVTEWSFSPMHQYISELSGAAHSYVSDYILDFKMNLYKPPQMYHTEDNITVPREFNLDNRPIRL